MSITKEGVVFVVNALDPAGFAFPMGAFTVEDDAIVFSQKINNDVYTTSVTPVALYKRKMD